MAKIPFSDVIPPEKRSIRNIPIPNSGRRRVPVAKPGEKSVPPTDIAPVSTTSQEPERYNFGYGKSPYASKRTKKTYIFGVIALLLIVSFVAGMMTVFASATINIVSKSQDVDVNMEIVGANIKEAEGNTVRYEIVKLSKSKTISVPATGEEMAELKASGKIVIYNNFSSEPQRLIVRTRFESPEGLIYRISESVVIPGKSVKNGVETPGSKEVEVFADEAGEKYNIKKSDFTIPGFKSSPERYKNFYARSSTDMSGGFIGKMKTVLPSEKQVALKNMDSEIQADLSGDLQSKVPEGLVLLSDSIMYRSRELPQKEEASHVVIGKEITAYAIMLSTQDLFERIISEYISESADWSSIKSKIDDFSLLSVGGLPDNFWEAGGKINLRVNGRVKVLADIDENTISQRLLGVPKGDVAKLMDEFAGILSIKSTLRPVWKQSFPKNPSKIYVQINTGG